MTLQLTVLMNLKEIMEKAKKPAKRKKQLVPRTHNNNTLTESQYFGKLRGALRQAFRWWRPMQLALDAASRPSKSKNKRIKKEYRCAECKNYFQRKLVEIHHIVPCGRLACYDDIVPFIKRLTAENVTDYAILCKECHKKVTLLDKENNKTQ